MKYQQVSVDLVNMMMTACSYLALAGAAWILLRLLQACFWLPRHFRKQNNVQKLLQEKVDNYEKYLAECVERDKVAMGCSNANLDGIDDDATTLDAPENSDKWRKQKECLEMLKKELDRVRDGVNVTDWDYLLEKSREEAAEFENGDGSGSGNEKKLKEEQTANTEKSNLEKKEKEKEEREQEQEAAKRTDGKKDK